MFSMFCPECGGVAPGKGTKSLSEHSDDACSFTFKNDVFVPQYPDQAGGE